MSRSLAPSENSCLATRGHNHYRGRESRDTRATKMVVFNRPRWKPPSPFPEGTPRAAVSRVRRPALLLFKCKFNFPFQRQSALKSGRVAHTRNAPLTGVSPKSGRPFCHSFVRFPDCFRWRGISTGISDARSTSETKSMRLLLDIGRIVPFSPDGKRGKCHPVQPSPRVYALCY